MRPKHLRSRVYLYILSDEINKNRLLHGIFKFRDILPTGSRRNRALLTRQKANKQNFAWFFSCRYWTDRAQNLPGPAADNVPRFHPNRLAFGGVRAERVITAK